MKQTNVLGLEAPLVHAIAAVRRRYEESHGEKSDISLTTLIGPPLISELKRRHDDELTEDASDVIYALFGSLAHEILRGVADGMEGYLVEKRLYANVRGWKLSGALDIAYYRHQDAGYRLDDWKVVSVWEALNGPKPDKTAQLNCLAEFMRRNGYGPVNSLRLVYLFRDWSKRKAQRGEHPPTQVQMVDVPTWTSEETNAYLDARVRLHQEARALRDDAIPLCTPSERWEAEPAYAVMKTGRKSALRLLPTLDEAESWKAKNGGTHIDVRPGEPTRCLSFCAAAPVCRFGKELLKPKDELLENLKASLEIQGTALNSPKSEEHYYDKVFNRGTAP